MTIDVCEKLKESLLSLDMDACIEQAKAVFDSQGTIPVQDAVNSVSEALEVVGRRFQNGDWFLTELVYSGEIAKAVMERLTPLMKAGTHKKIGTIVVGTVAGDLHDLGKNIFINYAKSAGFEVIDLGIDVSVAKFVSAVDAHQPLALGMSCLLTATSEEVSKVIKTLWARGVREKVKVVIGGAALTEQFAQEVGADSFASDAITGIDIVKAWSSL